MVDNQIMAPKAEYFDELVDRNLLTISLMKLVSPLRLPRLYLVTPFSFNLLATSVGFLISKIPHTSFKQLNSIRKR